MGVFENFPYTNFHEMNLDWIVTKVKEVITEWIEYKESVDAELTEFRTWFDNLDVQDEVRVVINEMVASGEFLDVTEDTITSTVTAWLTEHITPTTPIIDDTLTISGAAADAKVAGDRILDLKEDIEYISDRGVNLLPVGTFTNNIGGVDVTYSDGAITRSGTCTSVATTVPAIWIGPEFELKAGTYVFWCENASITTFQLRNANGTLLKNVDNRTPLTLSVNTRVRLAVTFTSTGATYNNTANIQIESGSSITSWAEPFFTAKDDIARADISDVSNEASTNTNAIKNIIGGDIVLANERTNQMYNTSSELKTETSTNHFYKVYIDDGITDYTLTVENVSGNNNHWYNEYDENDNLLYAATISSSTTEINFVIQNPNTKYIKVSIWVANGDFDISYYIYGIIDQKIDEKIGETEVYHHVTAIGDSITHGLYYLNGQQMYTENTYHKLLADHFNATFQNLGINSTPISSTSDYTGGENENAICRRYNTINSNADLIIVAGGTNDWGHNVPMGSISDTTDVGFYGALDVLIKGIISTYPNAKLIFITPFHRDYSSGAYDPDTNQNGQGKTLKDYRDAMIVKCEQYGIPCVDGYGMSGINITPSCKSNFVPDGLHPNPAGHQMIYKNLYYHLISLIL